MASRMCVPSGEVLGDVDLIWSNCRSFNEGDSDICDLADQAQQALRMRWQQEGLPTVAPLPPSARKKQKKDGKKPMPDAGEPCDNSLGTCVILCTSDHLFSGPCSLIASDGFKPSVCAGASDAEGHKKKKSRTEAGSAAETSSAAELSSVLKAVRRTLKLKVAGPFSSPVSEEDVPGYSTVIHDPMDLGTIAEKLKNGEYTSTGEI